MFLFGVGLLAAACTGDATAPLSGTGDESVAAALGPVAGVADTSGIAPVVDRERASWPQAVAIEIDRGCRDSACRAGAIAIEVTSLRSDPVEIEVFLAADGLDSRTARVRADGLHTGTLPLAGGERRRFHVDAAAMPIQPVGTLASARAELRVIAGDTSGGAISSPVAYEHAPDFRTVTLYDTAGAFARAGRLDPEALERPAGRVWDGRALVDRAALAAVGGDGYTLGGGAATIDTAAPSGGTSAALASKSLPEPQAGDPPPPGTHVCFDLKVQYNDAGIGEDYVAAAPVNGTPAVQLLNASYMRAWITQSGGGTVWDGYLTSAGCTGYSSMSGTYTIYVQSQFEKLVGGVAAHHDLKQHSIYGDFIVTWSRTFTVSGAPSTVSVEASSTSHAMNVAGVLARMYSLGDTWIPSGTNTTYVDKGCPGLDPPTDSCYSDAVYIGPGASPAPPQANDKFLVAHEYGHFVQFKRFGLYGFNYSAVADPNGSCRCDHVTSANQLHCMQSLEQYAAAFVEGFAHFYASKLYNNRLETDCHFGYYKEVFVLFGVLTPTVPVACASTVQWRDSYCSAIPNTAVEMDVMRFLWALHSTLPDRLTMDEIGDLLQTAQLQAGFGAITWSHLSAAAAAVFGSGSAKHAKVLSQASLHAVD